MDILGITEENKDLDMILIIAKEGMDYFFNRFSKLSKEEFPEDYQYFKQYFNMYLFNSDIWEITKEEQFKILAENKVNEINIRNVIDLVDSTNLDDFWENLLNDLDLIKMCKFLEISEVYKYYVNHPKHFICLDFME